MDWKEIFRDRRNIQTLCEKKFVLRSMKVSRTSVMDGYGRSIPNADLFRALIGNKVQIQIVVISCKVVRCSTIWKPLIKCGEGSWWGSGSEISREERRGWDLISLIKSMIVRHGSVTRFMANLTSGSWIRSMWEEVWLTSPTPMTPITPTTMSNPTATSSSKIGRHIWRRCVRFCDSKVSREGITRQKSIELMRKTWFMV